MRLLVLKIVFVPLVVAVVTIAGRRWGLKVGGLLTALPMVAGPALYFCAVEQGVAFAASAALASLTAIIAGALLALAYAHAATRLRELASVVAGVMAFVVSALATSALTMGLTAALATTTASLMLAHALLPSVTGRAPVLRKPRWDMALRMTVAGVLVILLTSIAERLGPRLSGVLAAFPMVATTIAVFTHRQQGGEAVSQYFKGVLRGLPSFAVYCFVSLPPSETGPRTC